MSAGKNATPFQLYELCDEPLFAQASLDRLSASMLDCKKSSDRARMQRVFVSFAVCVLG